MAPWALCPMALSLDLVFGEALSGVHPVVLIGRWGRFLEPFFFERFKKGVGQRLGGVLYLLFVAVPPVLLTVFLTGPILPPLLANLFSLYISYQLLAAKSLYDHVMDVGRSLASGDLAVARILLGKIVGRDTQQLAEPEIARAALESLSENLTDAVVAPLFFLFLGGAPLLIFYKAVSTMDSQVGYKNDLYRDLGWASARLDDLLAFVPARLTGLLCMGMALLGRSSRSRSMEIFRLILSERHFHPSPNSGHGISGYSALLRVRLGGGAAYGGLWVEKPTIGRGFQPPDTEILFLGLSLYKKQIAFVLGLLLLVFLFRWGVLGENFWMV